jgi:hypothetical protein
MLREPVTALWIAAACVMAAPAARGQARAEEIADALYPAAFVEAHTAEIHLTAQQASALRRFTDEAEHEIALLQPELDIANANLVAALRGRLQNSEILARLDKTMDVENRIKKVHLGLLMAIRDILNFSQRALLDRLGGTDGFYATTSNKAPLRAPASSCDQRPR